MLWDVHWLSESMKCILCPPRHPRGACQHGWEQERWEGARQFLRVLMPSASGCAP